MDTYRIFVSSPGDVMRERQRVERVVQRLNGEFSGLARLVAVRWENSFYQAHATFQTQIPHAEACDIVVAIFRGRLGTELPPDFEKMPDGEPYPSGTAYEVLTAIDKRQHGAELPDVYVFRCPEPPSVKLDDAEAEKTTRGQWERLKTFFSRFFVTSEGHFKAAFQTFSTTDDFEGKLERLLREWLSRKVSRGHAVIWPIATKGSPFPGLAAYDREHAQVFFGRSRDVARALDAWRDAAARGTPFLLIVGASGAGKSSLLRAGLAPRLMTPGVVDAVDAWRIAEMRPNEDADGPTAALAAALMRRRDERAMEQDSAPALSEIAQGAYATPSELASLLAHADAASVKPVIEALTRVSERVRREEGFERQTRCDLLLLIDQLDEVFAASVTAQERARFGKLLTELAATGRVWIAATLRADLYEFFLRDPSLFALKEQGAAYDLAPPGLAELAEIVRKPAAAAGLVYEHDAATGEALDERLLRDADRPDMLPLLQLALARLFEARQTIGEETRLTHAAYAAQGGLSGIIDKAGEEALAGLDRQATALLPRLLRHLAEPSHEGEGAVSLTARDARLSEAAPDDASRSLVTALVAARLLQSRGEGGEAMLRLSHQRVLTDWSRARTIVAESADFYRIREDIEARRQAYEASGRRQELLLPRGLPLAEAENIVRRYGEELSSQGRAFVAASRRRASRAQILTMAAACLFGLLAVGAVLAALEARAQRAIAERNLAAAERAVHGLTFDIAQGLRDVAGLRVETVRKVLERVRQTVDALAGQAANDPALMRDRAAMLNEFVRTYFAVGDLNAAEKAARESLDLFSDLARRDPSDPKRRRDLMLALNELAVVEDGLGNRARALALYEQALPTARELAARDRDNSLAQGDLALSLERIAGVRFAGGDRAGAQSIYAESMAILRSLVEREPANDQWRFGLSDVLDSQAAVLLAGGDKAGALKAYGESAAIVRNLVARDADNSKWASTLTTRLGELGALRLKMSDVAGALGDYQEALKICRQLVARDPNNTEWARNLAVILSKLADARLAARDRAAAISAYEEALSIDRTLVARDPDNAGWRRGVSIGLERLGDLKREARDLPGAKTAFEEMLAIRRALLARDPDNADWRRDVAIALERLANAENAMGDISKALLDMDESTKVTRGLVARDPDNAEWQLDLASSLTELGDIKGAAGDGVGALAAFEESAGIARARIPKEPGNAQWQRNLAVNLQRIGDAARRSGDLPKARSAYEEGLAIRRALLAGSPDDLDNRRGLMIALNRLGDIKLGDKDFVAARTAYEEALTIARALVAAMPHDPLALSDLAASLEEVAHLGVMTADDASFVGAYQEAAALRRRLAVAEPDDPEQAMALVGDLRQIGNARYLAGSYAEAASAYGELIDFLRGRVRHSDKDATMQAELATALDRIAAARSAIKDQAGELAARRESLTIRRSLSARDPDNARLLAAMLESFDRLVDLLVGVRGDPASRDAAVEEAMASAQLLAAAKPETPRLADIALRLGQIGSVGEAAGDKSAANAAYREALAICRRLVALEPDQANWRTGLVIALVKFGMLSDDRAPYLREALDILQALDEAKQLSPQQQAWIGLIKQELAKAQTSAADTPGGDKLH